MSVNPHPLLPLLSLSSLSLQQAIGRSGGAQSRQSAPTNPTSSSIGDGFICEAGVDGLAVHQGVRVGCCAARFHTNESCGRGGKWWAPLLGWSGHPDYINTQPARGRRRDH
uniref:Secreted protein n=1 Tax=Oryza glumipatula TaxID=40148 RepID=A0A0E0AAI5_9ORYZ